VRSIRRVALSSTGKTSPVSDTVLIDARNVQRSRWPNLSDEELVERARAWAERNGKRIVLVFDGKAPGGIVGATELDERTTLVGSSRESADDWLIREAPHYPRAWLVTSDRALRAAAGGEAERVIGGGGFLRELDGE
jgi:predicted RNA-binding protein with PIN domain